MPSGQPSRQPLHHLLCWVDASYDAIMYAIWSDMGWFTWIYTHISLLSFCTSHIKLNIEYWWKEIDPVNHGLSRASPRRQDHYVGVFNEGTNWAIVPWRVTDKLSTFQPGNQKISCIDSGHDTFTPSVSSVATELQQGRQLCYAVMQKDDSVMRCQKVQAIVTNTSWL